jgi:hypothetical protein
VLARADEVIECAQRDGNSSELRVAIECIAAMNDETLVERVLYALDRLLDGWSEHQVAL